MEMVLEGKNLYILNKKPKPIKGIEFEHHMMRLYGEKKDLLEEIDLKGHVKAILYCRQLKTIVFILMKETVFRTSLIMTENNEFEMLIREIEKNAKVVEQNVKINSYATSLVEKLQAGVSVTIMETKEESNLYCPTCGMQCDPNIPYCMECGTLI